MKASEIIKKLEETNIDFVIEKGYDLQYHAECVDIEVEGQTIQLQKIIVVNGSSAYDYEWNSDDVEAMIEFLKTVKRYNIVSNPFDDYGYYIQKWGKIPDLFPCKFGKMKIYNKQLNEQQTDDIQEYGYAVVEVGE